MLVQLRIQPTAKQQRKKIARKKRRKNVWQIFNKNVQFNVQCVIKICRQYHVSKQACVSQCNENKIIDCFTCVHSKVFYSQMFLTEKNCSAL